MNLKYHSPVLLFALAFIAAVYLSFKHDWNSHEALESAATPQERMDQINLSAMHAEPAPQLPKGAHASAEDLGKLRTLDAILAEHNDNDPRLDQDLRGLSPTAKALLRERYATIASEKRNQRGTVVYLLGRELVSREDVNFIHSVLNEAPCLSLSDCANEDKGSVASGDHHHDGMSEVTLAYPQLVALKSIQAYLSQPGPSELSQSLLAELEAARLSPVRKVASMADEIYAQYGAKKH